jgi:hypothetical protein
MTCACKPVLYLDGQVVKVLRIDFCPRHAQVDDLRQALAHALDTIERLTQGARTDGTASQQTIIKCRHASAGGRNFVAANAPQKS